MFAHIGVLIVALMTAGPVLAQTPAAAPDKPVKMVVLGNSLSAGLGLQASAAFPARLQKALGDKGIKVDMINAGVSGDTSSGGRDRLDWSIPEGTEAVILELGANDALRGIDPAVTRAALTDILTRLKARKIAVLMCGMLAPPNYGSEYAARFNAIYPELSEILRRAALSVFPGRCRRRRQAQPGRRTASDRGGHRCHREEYSAYGGGISRHDLRAAELKKMQTNNLTDGFPRSFPVCARRVLRRVI